MGVLELVAAHLVVARCKQERQEGARTRYGFLGHTHSDRLPPASPTLMPSWYLTTDWIGAFMIQLLPNDWLFQLESSIHAPFRGHFVVKP